MGTYSNFYSVKYRPFLNLNLTWFIDSLESYFLVEIILFWLISPNDHKRIAACLIVEF